MTYEQAFAAAWGAGGHLGALEFLRKIFHDPRNQKIQGQPTDYLNDRDEEQVSPAYGFDRMLKQFAMRSMEPEELLDFVVECLVDSRSPETDARHRIQPFNGLVALVDTYGHGDANLRSVHVDQQSWKAQYDLFHSVISEEDNYDPETEDDEDTYDFIYELQNGDRYAMMFGDKQIDGELLFKHVRTAQYAGVIEKLVEDLFAVEDFASFPKAMPFHCFISPESTYDDGGETTAWFPVATWTIEDFVDHPLRELIEGSAEPPPEPTREEKWVYLLGYVEAAETTEHADLIQVLSEHDDLFVSTLALARAKLESTPPADDLQAAWGAASATSPTAWAKLLWSFEGKRDAAVSYTRDLLELPLPNFADQDIERVPDMVASVEQRIQIACEQTPDEAQTDVRDAYDAALEAFASSPHPVARVLALENALRAEHGDEAVEVDRWGTAVYNVDPPAELVSVLVECISLMPEKFNGYGGIWPFVMGRLEALGERASTAAPHVDELLTRYSQGWCDEQLLGGFAKVLFALGVESPPDLIRDHCEKSRYHTIACYKPWAQRLPQKRWNDFLAAFANDPAAFADASRWEPFLVDSKMARDLFVSGMHEHERVDELFDAMCAATPAGSPTFLALVGAVVDALNKSGHKPADRANTQRVAALLSAIPTRDESQDELLRNVRFLLARFDIDAGGTGDLDALESDHPGHPHLLFMKAEIAERDEGPEAAGVSTIHAIRALSEDDIVYRKAFFTFAGVHSRTWDDTEPWQGLVAYRWAQDDNRDRNYRDGEFAKGPSAMSADPFYEGLEEVGAKQTASQREDAWREAKLEIAFGEDLQTLSADELAERMTPDSWNVTTQICRRLTDHHGRYGARLLDAYRWFREDENRRLALASMFWPHESFRPTLLADDDFTQDLAWLIRAYPGIRATDMARLVLGLLVEMGRGRVALDVARDLPAQTVIGCFLTVSQAIDQLEAFDEGIEILVRMRDEMSPKKPEYMLLGSNIGVFQFRKGDITAAQANYDELFAMDWSRFDYQEKEDDFLSEILGGDLKAQIADVFRQYFAMAKFNAACVFANCARHSDAVDALRQAAQLQPDRYTAAKFDGESDLDPVRTSSEYTELITSLGGA